MSILKTLADTALAWLEHYLATPLEFHDLQDPMSHVRWSEELLESDVREYGEQVRV